MIPGGVGSPPPKVKIIAIRGRDIAGYRKHFLILKQCVI